MRSGSGGHTLPLSRGGSQAGGVFEGRAPAEIAYVMEL